MDSLLLSTMLALAATMLGLSILVQIVQEVYKFLGSSKERAYTNALLDFLGPWARQLLEPGRIMKLQIRGPMQWFRFRPKQRLLPMEREELASALESTAPIWIRRILERLKIEVEFKKNGATAPSHNWRSFLTELGNVEKGSPGYWSAYQILKFLGVQGHSVILASSPDDGEQEQEERLGEISFSENQRWNPSEILVAFQHQFTPHIIHANDHFDQLQRNFDYQYERRNLRQTFIIAFILALLFNLSIQKLYQYAKAASPDEAIALAETSLNLYLQYQENFEAPPTNGSGEAVPTEDARLKELVNFSQEIVKQSQGIKFSIVSGEVLADLGTFAKYLFGCLITALLLSFGAPIWNDAASALLHLQKLKKQKRSLVPGEASHG